MMKKVSFCHIKSTLMGRNGGRNSQRRGRANANGDVHLAEDLLDTQNDSDSLCRRSSEEKYPENNKGKKNIFKTIRWKWRKNKRSKSNESANWNEVHHSNHENSRHDTTECGYGFRALKKIHSKHAVSRRVVCPVPSATKCVKRESNNVYYEIEDDIQSFDHVCDSTTKRTDASCASSLESDHNPELHVDANRCVHVDELDRDTTVAQEKDVRSVTEQTSLVSSSVSSSHSSTSNENNACQQITSNRDLTARTNDCSNNSAMTVPSYGTSSSDMHLYESVSEVPQIGSLALELAKLSKCGWYWGPITRGEAEEKLADQPDGAFLVRDSSDDHYLLSLSFRSYTRTFHTRIEHCNGLFSFYTNPEPDGHASIVELINQSMNFSQSGAFCYSRSRSPEAPSFPVRLTRPISRFTQVRSLQYLCRFTIRQYTRFDHLQKLPIPATIKGYLEERHY